MPTPVSSARPCLAGEAARALDDAVAVARRRAHAQTTSLHVVSALLSPSSTSPPPSSILKDALGRARSAAYSQRLQYKALELCFGVALDRLPSSAYHSAAPPEEPPVSNSLMAAIKRSQANQRRNADTFHLYQQQQQQQQQGFAGVKVELQQLVVAILDDPVVSRVFGEAGFRSGDIKLAVLHPPPPPILRFPRPTRCPPLFLCNLSPAAHLCPDAGEDNCRRIAGVLTGRTAGILTGRAAGRNPILIGVGAAEAAKDFTRAIEQQSWASLPLAIHGLKLISIERELTDGSWAAARLEELIRLAEEPGVVVSVGDLKGLVERSGEGCDGVVSELTRLLELHRGRLWVLGWLATYELYTKLLSRYPSLDKEWDLQLLPITSVRAGAGGLLPRPHSFMESFIPFGGFFPTAYESKYVVSSPSKLLSHCQHCNDKYEQELAAIMKGCCTPLDTQNPANLPSWLRSSETCGMDCGLGAAKTANDKTVLTIKVMDLQKKWESNCQRLHCNFQMIEMGSPRVVPHVFGLPYIADKEGCGDQNCRSPVLSQIQSPQENQHSDSAGLRVTSTSQSMSSPAVFELKGKNFLSKLMLRPSKTKQLQRDGFESCTAALSEGVPDEGASPSSVTSVTTDLVLATPHETSCQEDRASLEIQMEHAPFKKSDESRTVPEDLNNSCSCPDFSDTLGKVAYLPTKNPSGTEDCCSGRSAFRHKSQSSPKMSEQFDHGDHKTFFRSLIEKVGWQEEAICTISQAIAHCKSGHERRHGASLKRDIWLHFLGPDKVGKKRIAGALAELVYGSKENFICIDVGFQDDINRPNTICDQQEINGYDVRSRGKTITDHIAEELSKKPWSVLLLENVDRADLLVQRSLSRAIRTGKFSDSHGRAFNISNNIFVTTSVKDRDLTSSARDGCINFSEEKVLAAQPWQMKIITKSKLDLVSSSPNINAFLTSRKEPGNKEAFPCSAFVSKRKLDLSADRIGQHESLGSSKRANRTMNTFLDLNLPVEELVQNDTDTNNSDENLSVLEDSKAWLEEFLESVDETVKFEPFDFDALADNLMKEISKVVCNTIGSDCTLQIDVRIMEQMLAATWFLEDREALNNWFTQVLCSSFTEVSRRSNLSAHPVLKLVTSEDAFMDKQAPGILLPSEIVLE